MTKTDKEGFIERFENEYSWLRDEDGYRDLLDGMLECIAENLPSVEVKGEVGEIGKLILYSELATVAAQEVTRENLEKLCNDLAKALSTKPSKGVDEILKEFDNKFPILYKQNKTTRIHYWITEEVKSFIRKHCQPNGLVELDREQAEYVVAEIWGEFPKENYLRIKEIALKGVHSGDCTNECHSCHVCQYEEMQKHVDLLCKTFGKGGGK